jgi:PAS domain S-box-containing protein
VSPAYEEIWGRPVEELYEDPTSWIEAIHPDDRARVARGVFEHDLVEYDAEYRITRPDGEVRWVRDRAYPVTDERGEVYRIAGVAQDITARKEAERERRLLSTAVEDMSTGVLITGPELEPPGPRIEYVNEAMTRITGYDREELVGETPRLLQGPRTDRDELERLKMRVSACRPFEGENVNYRKDDTLYHLRWRITP